MKKKLINNFNDLSSTDWIKETVSVWTQKGLGAKHPDTKIEKEHPAPYSFTDISRIINFFTKKNDTVLDPFLGIGSTLKACAINGRQGIGIELVDKYEKLSKERLKSELTDLFIEKNQKIIKGDSRLKLKKIESDSIDLVVTSPPYWNILKKKDHKVKSTREDANLDTQYSNLENDLGNIDSYDQFLIELQKVFKECFRVLKNKKHLVVVVSDFRNKSKLYMFHSDITVKIEELGFVTKGCNILYQRHKRVFPYGYPYSYVPNIHHQYILIYQKDEKIIK